MLQLSKKTEVFEAFKRDAHYVVNKNFSKAPSGNTSLQQEKTNYFMSLILLAREFLHPLSEVFYEKEDGEEIKGILLKLKERIKNECFGIKDDIFQAIVHKNSEIYSQFDFSKVRVINPEDDDDDDDDEDNNDDNKCRKIIETAMNRFAYQDMLGEILRRGVNIFSDKAFCFRFDSIAEKVRLPLMQKLRDGSEHAKLIQFIWVKKIFNFWLKDSWGKVACKCLRPEYDRFVQSFERRARRKNKRTLSMACVLGHMHKLHQNGNLTENITKQGKELAEDFINKKINLFHLDLSFIRHLSSLMAGSKNSQVKDFSIFLLTFFNLRENLSSVTSHQKKQFIVRVMTCYKNIIFELISKDQSQMGVICKYASYNYEEMLRDYWQIVITSQGKHGLDSNKVNQKIYVFLYKKLRKALHEKGLTNKDIISLNFACCRILRERDFLGTYGEDRRNAYMIVHLQNIIKIDSISAEDITKIYGHLKGMAEKAYRVKMHDFYKLHEFLVGALAVFNGLSDKSCSVDVETFNLVKTQYQQLRDKLESQSKRKSGSFMRGFSFSKKSLYGAEMGNVSHNRKGCLIALKMISKVQLQVQQGFKNTR